MYVCKCGLQEGLRPPWTSSFVDARDLFVWVGWSGLPLNQPLYFQSKTFLTVRGMERTFSMPRDMYRTTTRGVLELIYIAPFVRDAFVGLTVSRMTAEKHSDKTGVIYFTCCMALPFSTSGKDFIQYYRHWGCLSNPRPGYFEPSKM